MKECKKDNQIKPSPSGRGQGEGKKAGKGWPLERRLRQAQRIRAQKIWEKTTGPKTPSGKDAAKMNAAKHGLRSESYRTVCALFREQQILLNATIAAALLELEQKEGRDA